MSGIIKGALGVGKAVVSAAAHAGSVAITAAKEHYNEHQNPQAASEPPPPYNPHAVQPPPPSAPAWDSNTTPSDHYAAPPPPYNPHAPPPPQQYPPQQYPPQQYPPQQYPPQQYAPPPPNQMYTAPPAYAAPPPAYAAPPPAFAPVPAPVQQPRRQQQSKAGSLTRLVAVAGSGLVAAIASGLMPDRDDRAPPNQQQQHQQQQHAAQHQYRPPRQQYPDENSEYLSPTLATWGWSWGVWSVIAQEAESGAKIGCCAEACDCCYWQFSDLLKKSLKQELCCFCTFTLMMALRVLLIPVALVVLLPVSVIIAVLHMVPAYCSFFHNIVIKSPRFGPVLKTIFAVGFIPIVAVSPAAIMAPVAFTCIMLPLSYAPGSVLAAISVSPLKLKTEGWKKKKMVYEHYTKPGPYYEIEILRLLAAIFSLVLCLVLLPVGYLIIAVCNFPRLLGALCLWTWGEDGARSECWCLFWPCLTVLSIFSVFAPFLNVMIAPIWALGIAITDGFMAGWDKPSEICEFPFKRMKEYIDFLNQYLGDKIPNSD